MKITKKNRVYGIEDVVDGLKVTGDMTLDGDDRATLNGRVDGTDGGGTVYYQEQEDGQVSISFSGCPKCGVAIYPKMGDVVARAKKMVGGPQETTEEQGSQNSQEMPEVSEENNI